jgi:hypothetical protein
MKKIFSIMTFIIALLAVLIGFNLFQYFGVQHQYSQLKQNYNEAQQSEANLTAKNASLQQSFQKVYSTATLYNSALNNAAKIFFNAFYDFDESRNTLQQQRTSALNVATGAVVNSTFQSNLPTNLAPETYVSTLTQSPTVYVLSTQGNEITAYVISNVSVNKLQPDGSVQNITRDYVSRVTFNQELHQFTALSVPVPVINN